MTRRLGSIDGTFDFGLELPPYEPQQPAMVGPGRGVPRDVYARIGSALELADFFRIRGFNAIDRGEIAIGRQDLRTADEVESRTPVDQQRFHHRVRTGNLMEKHGLDDDARQYRLHTIALFDR